MKVQASGGAYTVVKGDTLWAISRRHGVSLSDLIAANPQIKNPNLIYPGQAVNLPDGTPAAEGRSAAPLKVAAKAPAKRGGIGGFFDTVKDTFDGAKEKVGDFVGSVAGKIKGRVGDLLNIGMKEVGTRESGNNAGAITKYTGGKTGWPWCAKFVSWVYRKAGLPLPGGDQWGVAGIKANIKRLGQWKPKTELQPGMAVTFASHSHVEIIKEPVHKNGKLTGYMTVGGNTTLPGGGGQGVAHKFRSLAELEGGGYPVPV